MCVCLRADDVTVQARVPHTLSLSVCVCDKSQLKPTIIIIYESHSKLTVNDVTDNDDDDGDDGPPKI